MIQAGKESKLSRIISMLILYIKNRGFINYLIFNLGPQVLEDSTYVER